MRNINDFLDLKEISILCQYLYLKESNSVVTDNGLTHLEIRMDDEYNFYALNLGFPNSQEMDYTEMMTVPQMLGIVDQLKGEPPEENGQAKSRWDEIETIVRLSSTVMKSKKKGKK